MDIAFLLGIALAVSLGITIAPVVRWVLLFLLGILWVVVIIGGFLGAVAMMFVVPFVWRDWAHEMGLWRLAAAFAMLGASAGAMKLYEWCIGATTPAEDTHVLIARIKEAVESLRLHPPKAGWRSSLMWAFGIVAGLLILRAVFS